MRFINIHYIMILLIFLALMLFNWRYGNETVVFFGFAENKETEIRLEQAVTINQIYVTPGQKVKKGALLLEATQSGLQLEKSDLNHEVASLQSQYESWKSGLETSINQLRAQRTIRESGIQSQIEQLESEMAINRSLIKDLKSIDQATGKEGLSPTEMKIRQLEKESDLAVRPLNAEIRRLEKELRARHENPLKIQIDKLQNELGFVQQEEKTLSISAPAEGVIGSVLCKAEEQIAGFTTLLTVYDDNPTLVKSYVLESLILHVALGDSVQVVSGVQTIATCMGEVIGLGSRIVEIPERLRKNPNFKTYGREVLIKIPAHNNFLQREKVTLRLILKDDDASSDLIRAFTPLPTSSSLESES